MNRIAREPIVAPPVAAGGRAVGGWMRTIVCAFATCSMALPSLPVQAATASGFFIPVSSYDDDPFVEDSVVEQLNRRRFDRSERGHPVLSNDLVSIEDASVIYLEDVETGDYIPFAWNPWLPELKEANTAGNFAFPDEPRFPLHRVERGPDGKIVLRDGLQVWLPQDLHLGMTTTFEAVNTARDAAELWSGRDLPWGTNGRLDINAHAFIDFNAFYSPTAQSLYFGVVPHRLPGEPPSAPVNIFELATAWEVVVHESAHVLHSVLKPNRDFTDVGYRTWGESFSDQIAMWTSLRDGNRVRWLLAETNGDLGQSNALTRIGEVLAALSGEGTGIRDAFHDKKVSETSEEVHARSEVLTGAAYKVFLTVHAGLRSAHGAEEALRKSGRIMGTFATRAADYTPENRMTLEDVAKAYLKVDKEHYGSRHHTMLVDEFTRRELFDADSVSEWMAHEAATPYLELPPGNSDRAVEGLVYANLDRLGIEPDFGLQLQSVTRERDGMTIVHVQLTSGRGEGATPLDNHGILTFRRDGTLADYHPPLPPDTSSPAQAAARIAPATPLRPLISEAARLHLDQHGSPPSIVRRPNGHLTVEARVLRGEGIDAYMEVFTLDNPRGERREVVVPPVPPDRRVPIPHDLLQ